MCGILAVYDGRDRWRREHLERALHTLESRGPDAWGAWQQGSVFLGHRRLSIIDLETGQQPMASPDGRCVITYNGEVYNFPKLRAELEQRGHRFLSHSDTEVILAAYLEWGRDCVDHLEGMFAFAIWDERTRTLFAARDRVGIKPLCYGVSDGTLVIASTLEPFFALPGFDCQVDPVAIRDVVVYDYVPAPRTMLRQVRKLPPGHRLEWRERDGHLEIDEYWRVPQSSGEQIPFEELATQCESLISEAIEKQMISDVPLGAFLSGGIDSSLIVSFMAEHSSQPVKTFSVAFKEGSDEAPIARQVAERFGTDHTEFEAESIDDETLLDTLLQMDEPLSDPALIPTRLISRVAKQQVKVALSGEGGDELFGGYPRFIQGESTRPKLRPWLLRPIKWTFDALPWRFPGVGRVYPHALHPRELIEWERIRYGPFPFLGQDLCQLMAMPHELFHPESYIDEWRAKMASFGDRYEADEMMRADMTTKLSENHLFKSDRASMMESLEIRVPLLDEILLEKLLPYPADQKIVDGRLKAVLVELAKKRLPRDVWDRGKHGFDVPVSRYMAIEWRQTTRELISWAEKNLPIFDYTYLGKLCDRNERTHASSRPIWSPLVVIAWFKGHPAASL